MTVQHSHPHDLYAHQRRAKIHLTPPTPTSVAAGEEEGGGEAEVEVTPTSQTYVQMQEANYAIPLHPHQRLNPQQRIKAHLTTLRPSAS